ncbi:MAG: AAA family ATPase [Firmicutes bacterium]|nr:AAA family ATPase [Bacillota bacterium]
MARQIGANDLRAVCKQDDLGCKSTEELQPIESIVGQDRAIQALELGLAISGEGFNIYVAGEAGTGRSTAVNEFVGHFARMKPAPSDWCYAHNFRDPYQPRAIRVAAGQGARFARDVAALVSAARAEVPKAFEGEQYAKQKEERLATFGRRREQLIGALNQRAQAEGFVIQATPVGLLIVPLVQGRPMSDQEFAALPNDAKEQITARRSALESELLDTLREIRRIDRDAASAIEDLDREVVIFTVGHQFEQIKDAFKDNPDVVSHMDEMREDLLQNIPQLRGQNVPQPEGLPPGVTPGWVRDIPFRKYAINVVVDNTGLEGAPVVMEINPTYNNLFGRIEKEAQLGVLVTDFTLVRSGSLHRANGGYLIIPVEEILRNPLAYDGLKRALRSREIVIEEAGERLGLMATKTLRPQPIPLDVKVILIGTPALYQQLYALDPDFNELFKIKAEFDTRMERTPVNVRTYASFLCKLCRKEDLRYLDAGAAAKIVEHSSRLAGDQTKLSTHFAEIADIIREANFYAARDNVHHVGPGHVVRAIESKVYRSNLIESRLREMTTRGILKVETTGSAVGEINGLSVISLGDIAFGRPSRITASVGLGRDGIIDIEREAKLGGRLHSKGVMILGGYLTAHFAQAFPLSLSARLVFEQSYDMVDGDSASSAELYALLSAISGVPIRRGMAVTGSVNQRGEVQAIGGVNEKIEGFFEVCRLKGLTGDQGVIIPESNVEHLMLKEQVVETVREDGFHVYAVKTIGDGIEILTGMPAGERQPDGSFPEGTVYHLVQKRLQEMSDRIRKLGTEAGRDREQPAQGDKQE